MQNAAARLVSGARRHDHITPVLVSLHCLPVRQRISYNTAVLVWKCLHDAAPRYLADLCVPAHSVRGRQQLPFTPDTTLCSFKRHLKAHMFQHRSSGAVVTV